MRRQPLQYRLHFLYAGNHTVTGAGARFFPNGQRYVSGHARRAFDLRPGSRRLGNRQLVFAYRHRYVDHYRMQLFIFKKTAEAGVARLRFASSVLQQENACHFL